MTTPMGPHEYAEAVRAALADLPAEERDELLEDLDDHLAEVAAESDTPLEERLGAPEAYAAELRAVYGARGTAPRPTARLRGRLRGGLRGRIAGLPRTVNTRFAGFVPYRQAVGFLPELRPAWWVLRGYALALLVLTATDRGGLIPDNLVEWVFAAVMVWLSVWIGRRTVGGPATRWRRTLIFAANAAMAVIVVSAVFAYNDRSHSNVRFGSPLPVSVVAKYPASLTGVYNILPYAADGTPLRDVRLYDQDGRPITLDPQAYGQQIDRDCDKEPPIGNAYPLPLKPMEGVGVLFEPGGRAEILIEKGYPVGPRVLRPRAGLGGSPDDCPAPSATPAPSGTPSAGADPRPGPSESPGPTPTATVGATPAATPSATPSP